MHARIDSASSARSQAPTPAGGGPRGLARVDLVLGVAAVVVLGSVATTLTGQLGGGADSQWKLAELGAAHACYAADWNDRQWTLLPDSTGATGDDCASYLATLSTGSNAYGVRPTAFLGFSQNGSLWGLYVGGSFGCSNWPHLRPMNFDAADADKGAYALANAWGFREYVSRDFYSPEWYAEDDPNYGPASMVFFGEREFPGVSVPGLVDGEFEGLARTSFALSGAAMMHPGVLRPAAEGGFQAPAGFADSYRAPTASQCRHPSLKTRMCERGWYRNADADGLPFNASAASEPFVLFFDGSVQKVAMSRAIKDDALVRASSKSGDGLWSADTTLGSEGWRPEASVDGSRIGFHMLTTGGILGRDLLSRD